MLTDEISKKNRQKFLHLKKINLALGQYAITGSGALGIRNLREINDIDIIVNAELWDTLTQKYGVIEVQGVKKIVFPEGIIEVMGADSFYTQEKEDKDPTIDIRIAHADIIEGLPFESLEHVLYFKQKMGRAKDLSDILLIQEWQKQNQDHCS